MRIDRFTLAWWMVLAAVAAALCAVPLFDLLGFEFSFAMAIPLTLYAGACGVRARRADRRGFVAWARASRAALVGALPPLVLITANALRVQNCDFAEGLAFYGVITLTGAVVAAGWGVALGRSAPRRGVAVFALVFVGTVLAAGWRFWVDPPVDLFHAFLGYWPGALYDDVILIDDRLLWSRLEDLAVAAALVGLSRVGRAPRRAWLQAAGLVTLALSVHLGARAHAVHRDAAWVAEALGGRTETEHVVLIHPAAWRPAEVEALAAEMEFAYAELRAFFGFDLSRKATVWLYPDDVTKKRLMGARRVRIAKPWQWAFHVHAPAVGQSVIIHEMAHVFSAEIADAPHHLSLYRGVVPHMPLIEGLAEAATWKTDRLDLHQWSAAMQAIGVAPPLDEVLAPTGFYGRNSRTAYTLVGSFARYCRDRFGTEALAGAYRAGDFDDIPRPFDALVADWRAFVGAQALEPAALAFARARYDRPAIFGRACAHEIAALRARAAAAPPAQALIVTDEILGHLPGDIPARLTRIGLLMQLERWDAARVTAAALAADERAGAVARAMARERLADLRALSGEADAAREGYAAARVAAFARSDLRRLRIKRMALDGGRAGARALRYLSLPSPLDPVERLSELDTLVALDGDWAPGRYLRGRARLTHDPAGAADDLSRARTIDDASVRIEIERLLARLLFDQRCFAAAAARFEALAGHPALDRGEAERAAQWVRRSRAFGTFFAGRARPGAVDCAEIDIDAAALDDAARSKE